MCEGRVLDVRVGVRVDPPLGVSREAVTQYGDPVHGPTAVEVDLQLIRGGAVVHLGKQRLLVN